MKDQHKHIKGYRDLTPAEIQAINDVKELETSVRDFAQSLEDAGPWPPDSARRLALAKTHLEIGFMFLVKTIARPQGQIGSMD